MADIFKPPILHLHARGAQPLRELLRLVREVIVRGRQDRRWRELRDDLVRRERGRDERVVRRARRREVREQEEARGPLREDARRIDARNLLVVWDGEVQCWVEEPLRGDARGVGERARDGEDGQGAGEVAARAPAGDGNARGVDAEARRFPVLLGFESGFQAATAESLSRRPN